MKPAKTATDHSTSIFVDLNLNDTMTVTGTNNSTRRKIYHQRYVRQ